jgi:hypothetical protein
MSAIHGRPAEKCSCIFGMSAIHGRQKKAARFAGGFRVFLRFSVRQTDRDPSSACGFG